MARKVRIVVWSVVGIALVAGVAPLLAFSSLERIWPPGQIDFEMQLGPASGLIDGSPDWDECGIAALADWNEYLGPTGISFNAIRGSTRTPAELDSVNSAFFADDIFGTPFGSNTLAVANTFFFILEGTNQAIESDVIFNNAQGFNCYRGSRRLGPTPETFNTADLKRVALHEFGHVVGLDHPDEAVPPQDVNAIMNSINSDIVELQLDDIQGALTLYGVPIAGVPFPPRDQVLTFFLNLENRYRDTLGRQQNNQGNVNAEGSAVWFGEWGCGMS